MIPAGARTFLVLLMVMLGTVCWTAFWFTHHVGWMVAGLLITFIQVIDLMFSRGGHRDPR